jgi:hypothetical protein
MYIFVPGTNATGNKKLTQKTEMLDGVTTITNFEYNDNLLPSLTKTSTSRPNVFQLTQTDYPTDNAYLTDPMALNLVNRNMIGLPLRSIRKKQINSIVTPIFDQKTVYGLFTGQNSRGLTNNIFPKEIWVAPTGTTLEKRIDFKNYNAFGKLLEYHQDGFKSCMVWSADNQNLLGQIQNCTYDPTVPGNLTATMASIGFVAVSFDVPYLSVAQQSKLSQLRQALPNALVKWYTNIPWVGTGQEYAPNGIYNSFYYDSFQRLSEIRDAKNSIVKSYQYNYRPQ